MKHSVSNFLLAVVLLIAVCVMPLSAAFSQSWLDYGAALNDDQTANVRRSDHYRIGWGKQPTSGIPITEEFIQSNLQNLEYIWKRYNTAPPYGLNFPSPSTLQSNPDGNHYRANLWINNTHGRGDEGFAYGWANNGISEFSICAEGMATQDDPSTVTGHEHGHGCIIAAGGINNYSGDWHEGSANWLSSWAMDWFDGGIPMWASWWPLPHGRDYYSNTMFLETTMDEMGADFISTFFRTGGNDYIFNSMAKQVTSSPDGYNVIKNLIGRMAAKSVNFDYQRGEYLKGSHALMVYPVKEPGSSTWYRCPWEQAPSQGGFNVIPLTVTPGTTVTVNFRGVGDMYRGSDWRVCLVATSTNGDSRYSNFWNAGKNSITLSSDETSLYLAVASTPDFKTIGFDRDLPYNMNKQPQAYEIELTNATITEPTNGTRGTGWHQHSNGGGWVQDTASVDATAYVGPNAIVADYAQVKGNARIEDYAVVGWAAQIRDNAVVSGHAVVTGGAQVYGNAKVRDWASVSGSVLVYDNARILEHGSPSEGCQVRGYACVRGYAWWYWWNPAESDLSGYAIADGDAADGSVLDHGTSTGWSWGKNQGFDDSLPDTGGLFICYDFERPSTAYALDKYGMSWGYLIGRPKVVIDSNTDRNKVLQLNGIDQYIELQNSANDIKDTTIGCYVKWSGGADDQHIFSFGDGASKYMYLTPKDSSTGKLRFVITNGTNTQYIDGTAAVPTNTWTHVAVSFSGDTGTLYVNGLPVATNTSMTLNPDDLNAPNTLFTRNCNYVGKGNAGNYFAGYVDQFSVYSMVLTDAQVYAIASPPAPLPTPLVSVDAANLANGSLTTWPNTGSLGGNFKNNATAPVVQTVAGKKAVTFAGQGAMNLKNTSNQPIMAPLSIIATPAHYTISINVYRATIDDGQSGCGLASFAPFVKGANFQYGAGGWGWSVDHYQAGGGLGGNTAAPAGVWHNLCYTYDGAAEKLYIDGNLYTFGAYVLDMTNPSNAYPIWIGCVTWDNGGGGNPDRYFVGSVSGLQIYDRALTADEVKGLQPPAVIVPDTTAPTPNAETWLVTPTAISETSITMSATKGSDDSGAVEYYFTCTSGGGHDSGWITSNQYTDNNLTAGTTYTYTVKMRDLTGNTGTASVAANATPSADTAAPTPSPAAFAMAPKGLNSSSITMTAVKGTDANPLIEYKFTGSNGHTSGWQASPSWTDTGLSTNATATYTVQMRDGKGNTGSVSAASATATVRDNTPPYLPGGTKYPITSPWRTRPLVKPGGTVHMTVKTATDPNGVQYYFHCSSGGGPDSGWIDNSSWDTPVMADGTYTYQIKVRDLSPQYNETAYTGDETFTVSPKNVYHTHTLSELAALPDDYLVSFDDGTVTSIGTNYYVVQNGASIIKVMPSTKDSAPDSSLLDQAVIVKGVMWTYSALGRTVVYADVIKKPTYYAITASAGANGSISPSGRVLVVENTSQTFTITPTTGYVIDTMTVDGVAQTPSLSYTFPTVTANHSISVTFKTDTNSNLLLHYRFDETSGTSAIDSSGHARTGTVNGGATWAAGKNNNAISLDGSSGYVSIPDLGTLSNFTVATWVYLNSLPGDMGAILDTDSWTPGSLHCHITSTGQVTFGVNGWSSSPASTFTLNAGAWYHVVLIYNGTTAGIYINGISRGSVAVGTQTAANLTSAKLGSWQGNQRFINGKLDEYRIYNRALSSTEISNLYTNTITITASSGTNGSISPAGSVAVPFGNDQTFTFNPNPGYKVSSVMVDGIYKGSVSSYTFSAVTVAHTISVSFAVQSYTINSSSGTGGTISPKGAISKNYGQSQAFTITPNAGYGVSELKIDGSKMAPARSYTFSNISANHTISALFDKIYGMNNKAAGQNLVANKVVKVWGNVKSINGTISFVISDGSSAAGMTVMTNGVSLPTGFAVGKTAMVTGLMGTDKAVQAQAISIYP